MAAFVRHGRWGPSIFSYRNLLDVRISRLPTCCQRISHRKLTYQRGGASAPFILSQVGSTSLRQRSYVISGIATVRWNSTISDVKEAVGGALPEGYIPDPPPIPVPAVPDPVTAVDLNALGEPTLASLGLCNYTPPGLIQFLMETMHVSAGLPWWSAIVAGTIILRICIFPLVIKSQQNAASMHNHMPTIQRLQERFTKARMAGNPLDAARSGAELQDYMTRNKVNPAKSMLVPLAQMPIFVSVFVGLRKMANLPVDSMKTGGIFWFTDLTIPDPFYLLPLMTMSTFLLTVELGVDGVRAANMSHTMRWAMRIMPVVILPLIINFPTAMLCYWFTSNTFSLCQVLFLKIPSVRSYFKIPDLVQHSEELKPKKKPFLQGFKENWNNSKMLAEVEDRQRMQAVKFKDAGTGPIVKTYSYDPTKVNPKGIEAKKK